MLHGMILPTRGTHLVGHIINLVGHIDAFSIVNKNKCNNISHSLCELHKENLPNTLF